MTSGLPTIDELVDRLEGMTPEQRNELSERNVQRTRQEHSEFFTAFQAGNCYLCQKPLLTFSSKTPCLHWLLKPKGFKKDAFPQVAATFSLFQIQTYLRWVANADAFAKNINDLPDEGSGSKLVELTIRYRHLEWAFSCAESDFRGHDGSQHGRHPHYHFQMRVDQRPFIKYNDFHLPLHHRDILSIESARRLPEIVRHAFPGGEGMAEILNDETLEMLVAEGSAAASDEEGTLKLDTIIMADEGKTISGEDLYQLFQEAKEKGVTFSSLARKLPNARTQVHVSPGPAVVEQAPRTGRNKGADRQGSE